MTWMPITATDIAPPSDYDDALLTVPGVDGVKVVIGWLFRNQWYTHWGKVTPAAWMPKPAPYQPPASPDD